jgi:hypothetical protein
MKLLGESPTYFGAVFEFLEGCFVGSTGLIEEFFVVANALATLDCNLRAVGALIEQGGGF